MINQNGISSFLFFGYIPRVPANVESKVWALDTIGGNSLYIKDDSEENLVKRGARIFKSIFDDIGDGEHIVPLSGGLDSRAILGGLINAGKKEHIIAVSYGTPGTWDYDIGNLVAKSLKINHVGIDLNHIRFDTPSLLEMVRREGLHRWLFDCYYNRLVPNKFGSDAIYWSGFMGDALTGAHLPPKKSDTWETAVLTFVKHRQFAQNNFLAAPDFDPASAVPNQPVFKPTVLDFDDQMDFIFRQECNIRRVVIPEGYDYRMPFLHPDWVKFILNVPRHYREAQYLYKEILKVAYPRLFSMPVKNNLGLSLNAPSWKRQLRRLNLNGRSILERIFPHIGCSIHPGLNYIDFDRGLRERADLKAVVFENIQDLKKRRILDWIDIDAIWQRHQSSIANHADALTILGSLEISLKSQEKWP